MVASVETRNGADVYVASVRHAGSAHDGRTRWQYRVTMNGATIVDGSDMTGYEDDEREALGTFGSFFGAWVEAMTYGREDSDNRDLFPVEAWDVLAPVAEELSYLCAEVADPEYVDMSYWDGAAWVCEDCYFAHHYGVREVDGRWYSGDSDAPADREPLALLGDADVADATDSGTGVGIDEFSWSACEGCGSTLGGSRHRLVWKKEVE